MCGKFIFVVGLVLFFTTEKIHGAMPPELKDAAAQIHAACVAETGVGDDKIQAASSGNFIDDPALKCFFKCTWEKLGTMDAAGNVNVDGMIAVLPPDFASKVSGAIKKCGTQVGADPCDNAFLTNKCYYENSPNEYFVI